MEMSGILFLLNVSITFLSLENIFYRVIEFECTQCEKSVCAKVSLAYHMKKKHKVGGNIKCDKCDIPFPDFKTYTIHRALHRNNSIVKCEECDADIKKEKYPDILLKCMD